MKKATRQMVTIGALAGAGLVAYLVMTNHQAMRRQATRASREVSGYLGYELPQGYYDALLQPTTPGLPAFAHFSPTERDIAQHAVDIVGWLEGLRQLTAPREVVVNTPNLSTPWTPGLGVNYRYTLP